MTEVAKHLVDAAKALYRKVHAGTLAGEDILLLKDANFISKESYLASIYTDKRLFFETFSEFSRPYGIFRIFPEDSTLLDVGADWGYSALAMRHQGAIAKIVSVEALVPNTRELNVLKILENGRYDFVQAAVTQEPAELTFYIPAVNGVPVTGLNSTGGTLDDYLAEMFAGFAQRYPAKPGQPDRLQIVVLKVAGMPLDRIAANLGLADTVQAIKMDVEGHEASALRGARGLLGQQHPLIMIEGANRDPGVVDELSSLGYAHYDQIDGKLYSQEARSAFNDGYWLHPRHLEFYRQSGIVG